VLLYCLYCVIVLFVLCYCIVCTVLLYCLYCVIVLFLLCYCIVCTVLLYCFVYVYLFLFCLSVLLYGLLPPSDNSIAVSSSNNNIYTYLLTAIG
jgi:hypothetical protein